MKTAFPIEWQESYLPTPRHRNLRQRRVEETAEVEIREIAAADAPVAVLGQTMPYGSEGGIIVQEYRWFDNRLWVDQEPNERRSEGKYQLDIPTRPSSWHGEGPQREKAIEQAHEWARERILIDDECWRTTPEPVYKLDFWHATRRHGAVYLSTESTARSCYDNELHVSGTTDRTLYYPLTMRLEAEQARDAANAALRLPVDEIQTQLASWERVLFEVLLPEAIRFRKHDYFEFRLGNAQATFSFGVVAPDLETALVDAQKNLRLQAELPVRNEWRTYETEMHNMRVVVDPEALTTLTLHRRQPQTPTWTDRR
jgi:hypothetical protein